MKRWSNRLLILVIVTVNGQSLQGLGLKTCIGTRSQSENSVRELVGWQEEINRPPTDDFYMIFSVVAEYSRSFQDEKMARILFGDTPLVFSGSGVALREKTDILADYFGLPSTFKSSVCFTPVITNFLMDFNWYHGLDAWVNGLYYRIHMPIVHSKWDLNLKETILNGGVPFNARDIRIIEGRPVPSPASYPAGYLGPDRILLADLPRSVELALQGRTVFGDMKEPLRFGKIFGRQELTRASDIQCALGWNFLLSDWYHAGCALRFVIPAGNRSTAEFLFEPIIGNGGHWEVGLGLTSHVQLWNSQDEERALALYADANITHLCSAQERRSFDFIKNGPGSRYMLLTDNGSPSHHLFFDSTGDIDGQKAQTQYQRRLVPAINKTTFDIEISMAVQIDAVIKCAYQWDNAEFDIGYNIWACSKEKAGRRCLFLEPQKYGLKGDAQLYGFSSEGDEKNSVSPLNVTQSKATLYGGQGEGNFVSGKKFVNSNVDAATLAFSDTGEYMQLNQVDAVSLQSEQEQVMGSFGAIFIKESDINIDSGLNMSAITHKIFTHINYAWRDCANYAPYIGVGASAEWASSCPNKNSGHSQWSLWLKGGISY